MGNMETAQQKNQSVLSGAEQNVCLPIYRPNTPWNTQAEFCL